MAKEISQKEPQATVQEEDFKKDVIHKYSWKFIPVLFLLWLSFQVAVFFYVGSILPDFKKVGFPTSFEKAQEFSHIMRNYLETHYYTLLFFEVSNFLFLQTWCIPGTFVFNLLGGALFGIKVGFPICLACNTLGAFICFNISKYFAGDLIERKLSNQLRMIKQKVQEHKKDLFFYMLSTRLFPGSPNWAMNITFPHIHIPSHYFVFSIAIGLIPWNFLTCEAGSIISTFKSKSEIFKPETYYMLIGIAVCVLIPPIAKKIISKKEKKE
ncbi:hypothetical protein ABPG74_012638 [Tetrahymena malaccensis]